MSATPVVYILHGDDEVGIRDTIASLREKIGDPATADLNTTRYAGPVDIGELRRTASAVPFLVARRLVVLDGSFGGIRRGADQQAVKEFLEHVPESTALVIIERAELRSNHWLINWAGAHPERVYVRQMALPKGPQLVRWIQDYARREGGEITPQAARHLVEMIGEDNRHAASEVDKLLAYVNYTRAVELDDVDLLTAPVTQGEIFAMVDAIGQKNGRQALTMMHDLLAERDGFSLFGMIVRQFRLLLLYRELQDQNLPPAAIARELKIHDFVASKLAAQARNFDRAGLELIYYQLAELDQAVKTGQVELDVALDMLVAGVTAS